MIDYGDTDRDALPHVVCVNGFPRAGKDTLVALAIDALRARGKTATAFSMIDVVRNGLLHAWNIDTAAKTPADRALLVAVGDALETHSQVKFRSLQTLAESTPANVLFVQVREPAMIEQIKLHFHTTVVLVTNAAAEAAWRAKQSAGTSNATDDGVLNARYDVVVVNPFSGAPSDREEELDHYAALLTPLLDRLAPPPVRGRRFASWIEWLVR